MNDLTPPSLITDGGILESTDPNPVNDELEATLVQLEKLTNVVYTLQQLNLLNQYKFLSKHTRNALLATLLDVSDDIEARARVAYRMLKKIKRERAPETVLDNFLVSSITSLELDTLSSGEAEENGELELTKTEELA
jgi:hypothetical protein